MTRCIGLDFGTTNSALAIAGAGGDVSLAQFAHARGAGPTFRSVLFFDGEPAARGQRPGAVAGPRGIDRYLEASGAGRLLQSLKSFVASPMFRATSIFGVTFTLEELIAVLLTQLRIEAEGQFGPLGRRIVLGRPVRFVNSEPETTDQFPLERLRAAAALAGFDDVVFEYEPVAAAYFYEASLDHDELVLIADFGGGTSDFSLMRVGPGVRARGRTAADLLGTEGVGLAGDAFDSEVVDRVIAPRLGKGSAYRSYFDGKSIPVPPWIFDKLRRWHHLSFLKSRETMHFLREMRATAIEPAQIDALLHVIDDGLGYALYHAVEGSKCALSSAPETTLAFDDAPVSISQHIARATFEGWIDDELAAITASVERLLASAGIAAQDVDRVFLTGGTSFVPSVRKIFAIRFGAGRISAGNELTSVAAGLALRAMDRS
ncbi:MAG: Hsp70 family protein [Deltaproteobacteria bacterium]